MPTRKIIALGTTLAHGQGQYQDFFDYCLEPRINSSYGNYELTIDKDKLKGSYDTAMSGQLSPKGIIQSPLLINRKENRERKRELNVTIIPISDNNTINLKNDLDHSIKELLWKILRDSTKENILLHCASGIGRTGHLILTLEILRNYKDIFEANNAEIASKKIHEIVTRMRKNRFCLIQVEEQFADAIRNAYILYQYGLEKGYINESTSLADEKSAMIESIDPNTLLKKISLAEDKNPDAFLSLKAASDISSIVFESKTEADSFARLCKNCRANSQQNGDKLVLNHPENKEKFVIYLSNQDIRNIEKSTSSTLQSLIKITATIEPASSYIFTVNNKVNAIAFLKKYGIEESSSIPGKGKKISTVSTWLGFKTYAQVYLSTKELEKINTQLSTTRMQQKVVLNS